MASSFPGGLDSFTNPTATDTLDSATVPHADQHSNANDAIEAIESTLGVNPQGGSATVVARLDDVDTSLTGKASTTHASTHGVAGSDPVAISATQVTAGTLPVVRGGTGVTTSTGTGNNVLSASPTLTGVPTAPLAAVDTSNNQIASTAFVVNQASSTAPVMDGSATVGTSKRYARADHVHPSDTAKVDTTDSRLSDARTPTAHASTHGVAGSDPVTVASSQVTGLATSATTDTTNADNITSGTLPNARLVAVPNSSLANSSVTVNGSAIALGGSATVTAAPSGSAGGDLTGTYPNPTLVAVGTAGTYTKVTTDSKGRVTSGTTLSASDIPALDATKITNTAYTFANKVTDEYRLANTLDTIPRVSVSTTRSLQNGVIYTVLFTPLTDFTVSNLSSYCTTGGTDTGGTSVRRMGLFTVSGTTHTLVARTASDATLWNTASTNYTRALSATGGFPTSYTLTAGTTYAFGCFAYNTGGTFGIAQIASGVTFTNTYQPYMCFNLNSQTDLPTAATSFSLAINSLIFGRFS